MNSFFTNDFKKRESIISSSSSLSKESDEMEDNPTERSRNNIFSFEKLLFFCPLVLCSILLISGIVVFIIVEQRNAKYQTKLIQFNSLSKLSITDNYLPMICPFQGNAKFLQYEFALNELRCALNRSSLIRMHYSRTLYLSNPGENIIFNDILNPPIIELDKEYLSQVNTKSFVLILIDPARIPGVFHAVILHWIEYFSLSSEDEQSICSYKSIESEFIHTIQKILLLYATNSSETIVRAKTVCNNILDPFRLTEYITLIQLKLISSTHFFIPNLRYTNKSLEI